MPEILPYVSVGKIRLRLQRFANGAVKDDEFIGALSRVVVLPHHALAPLLRMLSVGTHVLSEIVLV